MNFSILRTTFLSIFFICIVSATIAQDVPEYYSEIGAQLGGNMYFGDVNSISKSIISFENMKNVQPDLGLFYRYKFNNRIAVRVGYDYTGVRGKYLYGAESLETSLNNTGISIIDMWGEYNFFEYENNQFKKYSRPYSPYIFTGIGYMFMPNSQAERTYAITVPFGVGMKWMLGTRWNLILQWTNHLLLSDNLEGLSEFDNPVPETKANFMNNDLLSGLTVGISFNFREKGCDCHNNRIKPSKNIHSKPLNNSLQRKK